LTCGYDSQTFKAYDNATFSLLGDVELRGNPIATGNLEQMVDILGMQTGIPCSEYEDQNYLAHTNTPNVVRDMDLIHTLMNYTTFNFWGFSYGTIIGAMYAQMYPQKVGRMILDGNTFYIAQTNYFVQESLIILHGLVPSIMPLMASTVPTVKSLGYSVSLQKSVSKQLKTTLNIVPWQLLLSTPQIQTAISSPD